MTVQQLIDKLNSIEDKTIEVSLETGYGYRNAVFTERTEFNFVTKGIKQTVFVISSQEPGYIISTNNSDKP
jgi:hypothetical protein